MSKIDDWRKVTVVKQKVLGFITAAKDVVDHHDAGEKILNDAADDLDASYKKVFIANVSAYVAMGGGAAAVGAGLFLTLLGPGAIIGVPLMVGGGAALAGGVATRVGTAIGDFVKKRIALSKCDDWIKSNAELSKALIEKCDALQQYVAEKEKQSNKTRGEIMAEALGDRDIAEKFQVQLGKANNTIEQWKTTMAMDVGKLVAALLVPVAAEVALPLPFVAPVLIAVDLSLLIKTAYEEHKEEGGTILANKLRKAAEALKKETHELRVLAETKL